MDIAGVNYAYCDKVGDKNLSILVNVLSVVVEYPRNFSVRIADFLNLEKKLIILAIKPGKLPNKSS
jgi:hypothetical protein